MVTEKNIAKALRPMAIIVNKDRYPLSLLTPCIYPDADFIELYAWINKNDIYIDDGGETKQYLFLEGIDEDEYMPYLTHICSIYGVDDAAEYLFVKATIKDLPERVFDILQAITAITVMSTLKLHRNEVKQ
jgi:hypothetical protein